MIRFVLSICLVATLLCSACSRSIDVEDAIRARLKEPSSAKFKDFVIRKDGMTACITWNAKNGFGGYGNWTTSELRAEGGKWIIKVAEQNPALCNAGFFALLDERDELTEKILKSDDAPPEIKAAAQRAQELEHIDPILERDYVESMRQVVKMLK